MRADSGENVARVEDLVLRMGVVLAIHCCWVIHSRRGTSLQSQPYPEFSQRQHLTLVGGGDRLRSTSYLDLFSTAFLENSASFCSFAGCMLHAQSVAFMTYESISESTTDFDGC